MRWYEFPAGGGEVIRPCESSLAGPCWRIIEDRQFCPSVGYTLLMLKLEQPRTDFPDGGVHLMLECLTW